MKHFIQDLGESKWYLLGVTLLFIAGCVLGYRSNLLFDVLREQIKALGAVAKQLNQSAHPQFWMFLVIFLNNSIKAFAALILGAAFGLVPIVFILFNGMILGFVIRLAAEAGQDPLAIVVNGILPHGILEIPALLLAGAYGIRFGFIIMRALSRRLGMRSNYEKGSLDRFVRLIGPLSVIIVTMLLAAAVIESTVTPLLIKH